MYRVAADHPSPSVTSALHPAATGLPCSIALPAPVGASQPTAHVLRHQAGQVSEPVQVAVGAVALRFVFGRCRIAMHQDGAWTCCGEASAGYLHVAWSTRRVRTEWLSDGEEVILIVPHDYWREHISARMRALVEKGAPRRYRDTVLQQLVRLLVQAAVDDVQGAYGAQLIDAVLMRGAMLCADAPPRERAARRHQALPAFRMARMKDYVLQHLGGPVTLNDMAMAAGVSPMHFAAQFREATGKRPHDYLLEQRIHRAKALMEGPHLSLYDVAVSVGFSTQAHFCTVFKRYAGITPGQWRMRIECMAA